MTDKPAVDYKDDHRQIGDERRSLLSLAATAFIVGAATGCVGAIFRFLLMHPDRLRDTMITWAHGHAIWGFLIVVGACAVATLVAAWMVRNSRRTLRAVAFRMLKPSCTTRFHRLRLHWCL
jgi:chloride channel protein, CIC family